MRPISRMNGLLAAGLLAVLGGAAAQQTAAPESRPRLLVLVVIDQCRADYLQRFESVMAPDGIARLLAMGSSWPRAAYTHTVTSTGPGHATIATGCRPARAGIPENQWFDPATGDVVNCASDPGCRLVGSVEGLAGGKSAVNLERPTLGDVLQEELGQEALVLSFGWKDRGALLLGGRRGDGSYWIDGGTGTWVGTSTLCEALPDWLAALNRAEPVRTHGGSRWERSTSEADALRLAGPDDAPGEGALPFGATFPHVLAPAPAPGASCKLLSTCAHLSPVGDAIVMDGALAAVEHTALGRDDTTDLLCVALGSLDGAGHRFGPDSQEAMDVYLAADRRVAQLLAALDRTVGEGRWTLALSSDHGVTPLSERTGVPRLDFEALHDSIEADLREALGPPPPLDGEAAGAGRWLRVLIKPSLWLDQRRLAAAKVDPEQAARRAAAALARSPGVLLAATRAELAAALASDEAAPDLRALALDVHATRSGDVLFLLKPGVIPAGSDPSEHGSQSDDDRAVPVILAGQGIAAGKHEQPAGPIDIAPTLATLLGCKGLQDADGRVLTEALATP